MGMVAILMIIISIATAWVMYSTTWTELIDRFEGKGIMLDEIFMELNNVLLARISLLILACVCFGAIIVMFIVHRVAGPLFRVQCIMNLIAKGIIPERIRFRRKDELHYLGETISEAISRIREFQEKNSEGVANAESSLKRAAEYLRKQTPETDKAIEEIESAGRDIDGFEMFKREAAQK